MLEKLIECDIKGEIRELETGASPINLYKPCGMRFKNYEIVYCDSSLYECCLCIFGLEGLYH